MAAAPIIYCPIRAINTLYSLGIQKLRLTDDNEDIHGMYLPWLTKLIENFSDLKRNPPKKLLIYSRTFGDKLKQKCLSAPELKNIEIKTISELL